MDHWFHGDNTTTPEQRQELEAKATALGIDPGELPVDDQRTSTCMVWPEHWQAVEMFLAVQTQWRTGARGVIGLDYGVILQFCELYEVEDRRRLMENLQVMEIHAVDLINRAAQES